MLSFLITVKNININVKFNFILQEKIFLTVYRKCSKIDKTFVSIFKKIGTKYEMLRLNNGSFWLLQKEILNM